MCKTAQANFQAQATSLALAVGGTLRRCVTIMACSMSSTSTSTRPVVAVVSSRPRTRMTAMVGVTCFLSRLTAMTRTSSGIRMGQYIRKMLLRSWETRSRPISSNSLLAFLPVTRLHVTSLATELASSLQKVHTYTTRMAITGLLEELMMSLQGSLT